MGFEKDLADAFANGVDRDRARFFAGRTVEIRRFDERLEDLVRQAAEGVAPSSLTLVFQGAPGCGKTSLVHQLGMLHPDALFVRVEKRHLVAVPDLVERIGQAASDAHGWLGAGRRTVDLVAGGLRAKARSASANGMIGKFAAKRQFVVVHVDEAQTLGAAQEEGLLAMHQGTLGVPVLPVLTGLLHTETALKAVPGMSRLADGSVVNMGGMSADECAESTLSLLDALGVVAEPGSLRDWAARIADLSRGWPQHLNRAQAALCRELARTGGRIDAVDDSAVEGQSDQARFAYYRSRMDDPVLATRPGLAAAFAARLDTERPYDLMALTDLCGEEMSALGIDQDRWFDPRDYVRALIERGVLAKDDADLYRMAIPSMRNWLVATHGSDGGRKPQPPPRG